MQNNFIYSAFFVKLVDVQQTGCIAVYSLPLTGPIGVGKSCLCNRFVRPAEDDFYMNHESLLSAADFNGPVVNNNHWLYWGLTNRLADDGTEYSFHVVEQTEFLDDTTFAALRGGKNDSYLKRCPEVKLQSGEKLMYICRDQLGRSYL